MAKLDKELKIFDPIKMLIGKYQSYKEPVSEVLSAFYDLLDNFQEMLKNDKMIQVKREYLIKICRHRLKFIYEAAQDLAHLLYPLFIYDGLSHNNKKTIEEIFFYTPIGEEDKSTEEIMEIIFSQYTA